MSGSLGPVYVHAPTSSRRSDHHEAKRGKRRLSAQARQKVNLLRNKPRPQCAIRRRTGAGRPDLLAHRVERRRHVLNLLAGHRPCRHQGGSAHERGIRRSMGEVCPRSAGFGGPRRCSFLRRPPMDFTAPNGARLASAAGSVALPRPQGDYPTPPSRQRACDPRCGPPRAHRAPAGDVCGAPAPADARANPPRLRHALDDACHPATCLRTARVASGVWLRVFRAAMAALARKTPSRTRSLQWPNND